jgi:hypothetical protein
MRFQAPRCVGQGLHQLFLDHADGFEVDEETMREVLVSDQILGGQDDRVSGQSVSYGVQARTLFAASVLGPDECAALARLRAARARSPSVGLAIVFIINSGLRVAWG